ncbi:MAG: phosphonatase-like hydrolase [Bacteroidia bacterium]|nr:phosphonatase-like hydrolase [Bacteroidia bacterium]
MEIKLVVFDMAGTTVSDNNNVHQALQNALKTEGVIASIPEINEVMGYPKAVAIRNLLEKKMDNSSLITDALINHIHEIFLQEIIAFYKNDPGVVERKGASEVFRCLREKGIKVALDTGFNRATANAIIHRLGWEKAIDVSITSDDVTKGRPHPDMIFRAMELVGVTNVLQVAKVGDTLSDIQEGRAAGCRYIVGILNGAYQQEELQAEQPTHIIHDLPEILNLVNQTFDPKPVV